MLNYTVLEIHALLMQNDRSVSRQPILSSDKNDILLKTPEITFMLLL